jgi:AmiR/NasT family two-component response regulator
MKPQASTTDPLKGKRALTVEDEGITQMQLSRILKGAGMEHVGLAMTGPQGVALALESRPDIILMDINMPGEYNGLEAARRILQTYRACIVILTAYSDCADQAAEIGVHGYVVKPLERTTLLQHLREAYTKFEGHSSD